ncbi:hypothetical protein [Candidatus Solincola tengchongensis]|uniref:hypothetical protein n=1 Tax=Candidatus Solincola tengchongensis TaxID=2900693 RepID=UPI00257E8D6C|nr:hypothetical protein [Candidatus Solincola tengchongensis]
MDGARIRRSLSSQEGQVWTYVLRIFLAALIIGIIISQCGPVIANHIATRGTAKDAAELAADTYQKKRGNMDEVRSEVAKFLNERGARLDGDISLEYDQAGRPAKIVVPVRKIVNTFFFQHVGYLSPYTEAKAVGEEDLF